MGSATARSACSVELCGLAPGESPSLTGRQRHGAGRRLVMLSVAICSDVVGAEACVHRIEVDELHVAGIDPLIADGDDLGGEGCVAGLEREPLRESVMD